MSAAYRPGLSESRPLSSQIRMAELKLLGRRQAVSTRTARLVRALQRQISSPSSLLLAGGIGFIIGELTKRQTPEPSGVKDKPQPQGPARQTALGALLNGIKAARTLYTVLPLLWLIRNRYPGKAAARQSRPPRALTAKTQRDSRQRGL